jgi:two-component system, chemotaxis family, chemotaxis protein CheY
MNILVADDDKVVSMLICGILRQEGHQALAAFDQMQVLMFAAKTPGPDVIILDLNMPGGTGRETLRRLKASAKTRHICVIVLSGTTDPDAPAVVRELGGNAFLPKPVNREHLLAELALVIDPGIALAAEKKRQTVSALQQVATAVRFTYE